MVAAARSLSLGAILTDGDISWRAIPTQYASGMVTDPEEVIGRTLLLATDGGAPIWESTLAQPDLSDLAPPGLAVVPIRLEGGTAQILTPGDSVDLLAVSVGDVHYLARSALVLPPRQLSSSGGGLLGGGFSNNPTGPTITLVAVHPDEAPGVAQAAHFGSVTAILVPKSQVD